MPWTSTPGEQLTPVVKSWRVTLPRKLVNSMLKYK